MTDRVHGREASHPRPISSLQNDRIKAVRALDMRKARRETGLFVAEGASILVTAQQAGFDVRTLIYEPQEATGPIARDLIRSALANHAEVLEVSSAVLAKVSSKDNPQAMLGVFDQRWEVAPDPEAQKPDDLWLVLEEVRDPGNLGTMIRTIDAVGGRGIILVGNCCDPYSRECVRATMGSIFSTPLVKMQREEFLTWRAQWPGDVVGLHLRARDDFRKVAYNGPVMVVMGSEGPGLSAELSEACSRRVKIPMAGKLDSLNLAIATALTLYQIRGPHLRI